MISVDKCLWSTPISLYTRLLSTEKLKCAVLLSEHKFCFSIQSQRSIPTLAKMSDCIKLHAKIKCFGPMHTHKIFRDTTHFGLEAFVSAEKCRPNVKNTNIVEYPDCQEQ